MRKKRGSISTIIFAVLVVASLLISGCGIEYDDSSKKTLLEVEKPIVCNPPYIESEGGCCLDKNNNIVCDNDEAPEEDKEKDKDCTDECSTGSCDGLISYDCILKEDGCRDKISKGKIKGKCDVECLIGSDCGDGWNCSDYKCELLLPELEFYFFAELNNRVIGMPQTGPSVSASTLYSNRNLIPSGSDRAHNFTPFVIKNIGEGVAKSVLLKMKIEPYTDWQSFEIGNIEPGEFYASTWNPVVSEEILNVKEAKDVPIEVHIMYLDKKGDSYEKKSTKNFRLLGRNEQDMFTNDATFITSNDPTVKNFISSISQTTPSTKEEINSVAEQIWDVLRVYGIQYGECNKEIFYPSETLNKKEGYCLTLSLLYSTLLESVGIKTRIIRVQLEEGHALMSYYNTESWIPVDAVAATNNYDFETAKARGLERSKDPILVVDIHEEWNKGIKPPEKIDVGPLDFSNLTLISVSVNPSGSCDCSVPDLVGCLTYQIQISCTYTFTNIGDTDANKCINGIIYLNGQSVKEEQICVDVPARQTEQRLLEFTKVVSDCGGETYSCTFS